MLKAGSVTLLLLGGLLGSLGGLPWVAAGGGATALLLVAVIVRHGPPRLLAVIIAVAMIGMLLNQYAPEADLGNPAPLNYGDAKVAALLTTTPLSAAAALLVWRGEALVALARSWLVVMAPLALIAAASAGGAVRAEVLGANPVWAGRAMAEALIAAAWLGYVRVNGLRRGLAALLGVLMVAGLFATGSRGPTLGAAIGLAMLFFIGPRAIGSRAVRFIALASVIGAVTLTIPGLRSSRALTALTGGATDSNATVRIEAWKATLRMISDNPLGVGVGNWYSNAPRYGFTPDDSLPYPHNLPLEVFAELGWIAGALLLCLTFVAFRRVVRQARNGSIFALLVLALLACETVSVCFSGDMTARAWWFFLALALVVEGSSSSSDPRQAPPAPPATHTSGIGFLSARTPAGPSNT